MIPAVRASPALCGLALACLVVGHAAAQLAPTTTILSSNERVVLSSALAAPSSAPEDDAALIQATLQAARVELGQRVRPSEIDRFWALQPPVQEVSVAFEAARRAGQLTAWLAALSPPFPEYRALQAAAGQYRVIVQHGGWKTLPSGPALKLGDDGAGVASLRARLSAEGYAVAPTGPIEHFDDVLRQALARFQVRHTLMDDGALGAETRAALDISAQTRLDQIEANLERWRWMPRALPADRLEVDIAAAEASLYRASKLNLRLKVVVGDPTHRTPMLASRLEAVVFNPPWIVPASIAEAEILPKAAKDPGYMARNDFAYVDGRLEQRPGPKNALGVVKFDLPSPFGVYLHDTPAKSAFARRVRALSHGCMRLQNPLDLADRLLSPQGWTVETIQRAIDARTTLRVGLKTPTPLFVVYWTAVIGPDGQVVFRPDVYGWDRKLTQALAGAPLKTAALARMGTECADVTPQG